jgi:hypothetical protein
MAAKIVGRTHPPVWQTVAEGLVLARDGVLVLEYDGYDGKSIKQADVELLTFPLEHPLSAVSILANLQTYRKAADPDGPAMGRSMSAIVAAQLGRRDEAFSLFSAAYQPHLYGPFYALAETPTNGAISFLTGVGGALQALLFGFAGIRLHDGVLAIDPLLPASWSGLHFASLHWRGQVLSISVLPGDYVEISNRDARQPAVLVLRRWRPGPAPLYVAARADNGAACTVEVPGWRVEPLAGGREWQVYPPSDHLSRPFVRLCLTVSGPRGRSVLEVEQRVGDGDI